MHDLYNILEITVRTNEVSGILVTLSLITKGLILVNQSNLLLVIGKSWWFQSIRRYWLSLASGYCPVNSTGAWITGESWAHLSSCNYPPFHTTLWILSGCGLSLCVRLYAPNFIIVFSVSHCLLCCVHLSSNHTISSDLNLSN